MKHRYLCPRLWQRVRFFRRSRLILRSIFCYYLYPDRELTPAVIVQSPFKLLDILLRRQVSKSPNVPPERFLNICTFHLRLFTDWVVRLWAISSHSSHSTHNYTDWVVRFWAISSHSSHSTHDYTDGVVRFSAVSSHNLVINGTDYMFVNASESRASTSTSL